MCKTCKVCNNTYEDINANFSKAKAYDCGYNYLCKTCDSKRCKLYRERNADKEKERSKRYRENNKEIRKERQKLYGIKYKEKKSEYYQKNKNIIREKNKLRNQIEIVKIQRNIASAKLQKKYVDTLADCYIKGLLKKDGYKIITPEMIQSKREFLENKRKNKFLII